MKAKTLVFEEIREHCYSVGAQNVGLFGGRFEGGYELQQNPEEISRLIKYIKDIGVDVVDYLEIGCCGAGLTRLMTDVFDIYNVTVVDLGVEEAHLRKFEENINVIERYSISVEEFIGDSHSDECLKFLCDLHEEMRWELVVIDGDHSYEGLYKDIDMVLPLLDKGTLIALHDVAQPFHIGPPKVFAELKNGSRSNLKFVEEFIDPNKPIGLGLFEKC
jgi:predicted O-methyltransferase YrrM